MTEADSSVFYCYRCGNRVKRAAGNCWYCGAPNRRSVRPSRHCPFCGEEIAQKAVKCPHCSEFLDGRAKPEPAFAGPPQHVTFVIDKAVIQGDQPLMLEGGQPAPSGLSKLLSRQTIRAIESNRPGLIDQQGVKALPFSEKAFPPPGGPRVLDAEAAPASRASEKTGRDSDSAGTADARSGALIRREAAPPAPILKKAGGAVAKAAGSALSKLSDRVLGAFEGKRESPLVEPEKESGGDVALDAEEVEKYKTCTVCGAEVLAEDNYCFHCGATLRKFERTRKKPMGVFGNFPFAILSLCTLLLGGMICLLFAGDSLEDFTVGSLALRDVLAALFSAICLILLAFAFFARRTALSQTVVIVYFVLWVLVSLAALITSNLVQ